jgi:integrase
MAGKRLRANGTWEFVFKRKGVLAAPVSMTFDTLTEGEAYEERAEAMLAKGLVPPEMSATCGNKSLRSVLDAYAEAVALSDSEKGVLPSLRTRVAGVRVEQLNYAWAEKWLAELHTSGLASSTVAKQLGQLARVVDWAMRRGMISLTTNPLRTLPRGCASRKVGGEDAKSLYNGERNRVLSAAEEDAVRAVLARDEERLLFDMALETAMRMSEMYTLAWESVDLDARTIFLERTKTTRRGRSGRRQVPITSVLLEKLAAWDSGSEWLFPMWWTGGDQKERKERTAMLSHLFARRFRQAGIDDLHFHDLRHTAITHMYERTSMTDLEIASISGHRSFSMLQRYANLRASTLAGKMW